MIHRTRRVASLIAGLSALAVAAILPGTAHAQTHVLADPGAETSTPGSGTFVGWTQWGGGGAFAYTYLLEPVLQAISTFFHGPILPPLHIDPVYTEVTLGLLGLDTSHMAFKHAVNNGVFTKN